MAHAEPTVSVTAPLAGSFVRFAVIGGIGTAVHFAVLAALAGGVGVHAVWASQIGAVVGALVNYLLNRSFNYRSSASHWQTGPRFALVVVAGWLINGGCMAVFVEGLRWHWLVAQVLTTALVLSWNFGVNHFWTFRHPGGTQR